MYGENKVRYFLDLFLFPGLVMHEFAHALIVEILPQGEITDFKVTLHNGGHVEYKYYPTATRSFLIGFAPFYVNTLVSVWAIKYLLSIELTSDPLISIPQFVIVYVLAVSCAARSMPSYVDATSHIKLMREQLFTRKLPMILLLGPIYIVLSLPGIAIGYLRTHYSTNIYYASGVLYALLVVSFVIGVHMNLIELEALIPSPSDRSHG